MIVLIALNYHLFYYVVVLSISAYLPAYRMHLISKGEQGKVALDYINLAKNVRSDSD